jgi:cell division protein FtsB
MKNQLDKITKRFLLNEEYDPTTLSSIQSIFEMLSTLRILSQRDTNRVEIAKEQLVKVRRQVKRIQERNKSLEEQVTTLEEQLKVLEETKTKKKGKK